MHIGFLQTALWLDNWVTCSWSVNLYKAPISTPTHSTRPISKSKAQHNCDNKL